MKEKVEILCLKIVRNAFFVAHATGPQLRFLVDPTSEEARMQKPLFSADPNPDVVGPNPSLGVS
jgi:hypothetical protein